MKITKIIVVSLMFGSVLMAHCGTCGTGDKTAKDHASPLKVKMEKRMAQLDLSDKQDAQVKKINQKYFKEMKKVKARHRKALSKVLTSDQMKQLSEKKDCSSCSDKKETGSCSEKK